MTTPTYSLSKDVLWNADERLDLPDAKVLAQGKNVDVQNLIKLFTRPQPGIGRVFFGFVPTISGTAVQIGGSGASLATDADGNLVFQAAGVAPQLTLAPSSTSYIYAYYVETLGDQSNRRFINELTQVDSPRSVTVNIKKTVSYVAFSDGVAHLTTSSPDAYGNPVTRSLVQIAVAVTDGSGNITSLTDARRLWGIDSFPGGASSNPYLPTEQIYNALSDTKVPQTGTQDFFSLVQSFANALSTHAGGAGANKSWNDITSIGNLGEVFTARGSTANLNARITQDHLADGTHSDITQVPANMPNYDSAGYTELRKINNVNGVTVREFYASGGASPVGTFVITKNAKWDPVGHQWQRGAAGFPASAFFISPSGVALYTLATPPASWADLSGWGTALFIVDGSGNLAISGHVNSTQFIVDNLAQFLSTVSFSASDSTSVVTGVNTSATSGAAFKGTGGSAAGPGFIGVGGAGSGPGFQGMGGAPNGPGFLGQGVGTGPGGRFVGGTGNSNGVTGVGNGTGYGVYGTGGTYGVYSDGNAYVNGALTASNGLNVNGSAANINNGLNVTGATYLPGFTSSGATQFNAGATFSSGLTLNGGTLNASSQSASFYSATIGHGLALSGGGNFTGLVTTQALTSSNRVQGVVVNLALTGGNGTGPQNRVDGDMWTNTNRLYIRLNGNDYLIVDGGGGSPSGPLGTIANNGTVL